MAKFTLIGAAVVLISTASVATAAQQSGASTYDEKGGGQGASSQAPGHKMKQHRSASPSDSTPGHKMKQNRSASPSGSKDAPMHEKKEK